MTGAIIITGGIALLGLAFVFISIYQDKHPEQGQTK